MSNHMFGPTLSCGMTSQATPGSCLLLWCIHLNRDSFNLIRQFTVLEERRRKFGHLMLENRLCVAMSRQQRLLVAVGDLDFVRADDAKEPLRALRAFAELCGGEHGIVR